MDDVVGLQVAGNTLREVTASAECVGGITRRPSSLDCATCQCTAIVSRRVTGSSIGC